MPFLMSIVSCGVKKLLHTCLHMFCSPLRLPRWKQHPRWSWWCRRWSRSSSWSPLRPSCSLFLFKLRVLTQLRRTQRRQCNCWYKHTNCTLLKFSSLIKTETFKFNIHQLSQFNSTRNYKSHKPGFQTFHWKLWTYLVYKYVKFRNSKLTSF